MSPVFGCICPSSSFSSSSGSSNGQTCDQIFKTVNGNPCIGKRKQNDLSSTPPSYNPLKYPSFLCLCSLPPPFLVSKCTSSRSVFIWGVVLSSKINKSANNCDLRMCFGLGLLSNKRSVYKIVTLRGHPIMTSRNFENFRPLSPPPPHRHVFYYWGISTVVTKSLTPSPLKTVTSFMDDP